MKNERVRTFCRLVTERFFEIFVYSRVHHLKRQAKLFIALSTKLLLSGTFQCCPVFQFLPKPAVRPMFKNHLGDDSTNFFKF
jgi:hypothetical protein